MPEPVAVRTGEPLEVREKSGSYNVKVKEKTGEIRHRDSHGRSAGTSTIYSDRIKRVHWHEWAGYQGNTQVSDDDLYRLANDAAAEKEVREKRESGVFWNRVGYGMLLGGLAAAGTGLYFNSQQTEGSSQSWPMYTLIGGAILGSLGMSVIYAGSRKVEEKHPLPQERAEAAVEKYNASLGGAGEASTTGARIR